jgi:hypothetical protein
MNSTTLIFDAESIRAILAGTKTETRVPVEPQPSGPCQTRFYESQQMFAHWDHTHPGDEARVPSPFGNPGDRLWVPIHMPRWASRITLEVASVRVERVQEIRCSGLLAEGVCLSDDAIAYLRGGMMTDGAVEAFADRWDAINAKRGYGWDANPWVWVYEFRRVEAAP